MPEGPSNHFDKLVDEKFFRFHGNGPGLDLREIKYVINKVLQIAACSPNGARELHLLGGKVAIRVLAHLLSKNQNAVKRSTEFMRHVGKELRFVLRCKCQLGCLVFQRTTSLLDLLVFLLHFDVALR